MRNSVFREDDFMIMEEFLHSGSGQPIEDFYRSHYMYECTRRYRCQYYPHDAFVIVYLEDFVEIRENEYKCC